MAKRKFIIPKRIVRQAQAPGMNKQQVSAYLSYMNKNSIGAPAQPQIDTGFSAAELVQMGSAPSAVKYVYKQKYARDKLKKPINPYKIAEQTAKDYAREREYKENLKRIQYEEAKKKYLATRSGKVSQGVSRGFSLVRSPMQALARWGYGNQMAPAGYTGQPAKMGRRTVMGRVSGGKGRPRGSYNPLYARYGGVYGYRKAMAHQRRLQRIQAQSQANVTPEQAQALAYIRARQQQAYYNPERQVIPDTSGSVPMQGYMNEIDDAAGLVD